MTTYEYKNQTMDKQQHIYLFDIALILLEQSSSTAILLAPQFLMESETPVIFIPDCVKNTELQQQQSPVKYVNLNSNLADVQLQVSITQIFHNAIPVSQI